jgi:ABC-type bacteriocin/lantibiotic exporter with double-glycine peptidase domain
MIQMEFYQNESIKGDMSSSNILFAYPSRPKVVVLRLGHEQISIPAGKKKLAIVGSSGSGKSTLIGLLLRWYDAQRGDIKIDSNKNTDYNIKWLRS